MRQKFGQNFLIDKNVAESIIESANFSKEDDVIEIGPGRGILTELIHPLVRKLTAVEIDSHLASRLREKFKNISNLEIINRDFLGYEGIEISREANRSASAGFEDRGLRIHVKYISNLPYNVATVIIEKLLPQNNWETAVFMVQKEVGDRIFARPGTSAYGSFSIICQYYAEIEKITDAGPACFSPQPKVSSVVLRFTNKYPEPPDPGLFKVIRLSFQHRRKTILNSLSKALKCDKATLIELLINSKIDPMIRPEKLGISEYKTLTNSLKKYIIL